jgi:hypothetical protein
MQPKMEIFNRSLDSELVQFKILKFAIFSHKLDKWLECPTCDRTSPCVVTSWTRKPKKFDWNLDKGCVQPITKLSNFDHLLDQSLKTLVTKFF